MKFQKIKPVQPYQHYLDKAFRRAKKAGDIAWSKNYKIEQRRLIETDLSRVRAVMECLAEDLRAIIKTFPNVDDLPEFYCELVKCTIDYPRLKKSFGAVIWAQKKVDELSRKSLPRLRGARSPPELNKARSEYFGRVSSVLKQISHELEFLESARKTMQDFPNIDTELFTVAIAGFPNVGKSTLLSKLTASRPDIQTYPFTTKGLNLGYGRVGNEKLQFIDTPGTLNRIDKMNRIEKQAFLAIKHCADLIIYVFDITEPYPLEQQKTLLDTLKTLEKRIILYLSKTDILDGKEVLSFKKEYPVITSIEGVLKAVGEESRVKRKSGS